MSSRQVMCSVALIVVVGALFNAIPWFLSLRAAQGAQAAQNAATGDSDNVFRYDGKTLEQWRSSWQNELKPGSRVETVRAMSILGRHGCGKDAAEAIMEVVQHHCRQFANKQGRDSEDTLHAFVHEAAAAVAVLGEPAATLAFDGLRNTDKHVQLFCGETLKQMELPASAVHTLVEMVQGDHVEHVSLALQIFEAHLASGKDQGAVTSALNAELAKLKHAASLLTSLRRSLTHKEACKGAAVMLGVLGPSAQSAVPNLLDALRRKGPCRTAVVAALGKIGCEPERVIPLLVAILEEHRNGRLFGNTQTEDAELCKATIQALGQYGTLARLALPELLRGIHTSARCEALEALTKLEAAPNLVVPILAHALTKELDATQQPSAARPVPATPPREVNKAFVKLGVDYLGKVGPAAREAVPVLVRMNSEIQDAEIQKQVAQVMDKLTASQSVAATPLPIVQIAQPQMQLPTSSSSDWRPAKAELNSIELPPSGKVEEPRRITLPMPAPKANDPVAPAPVQLSPTLKPDTYQLPRVLGSDGVGPPVQPRELNNLPNVPEPPAYPEVPIGPPPGLEEPMRMTPPPAMVPDESPNVPLPRN